MPGPADAEKFQPVPGPSTSAQRTALRTALERPYSGDLRADVHLQARSRRFLSCSRGIDAFNSSKRYQIYFVGARP